MSTSAVLVEERPRNAVPLDVWRLVKRLLGGQAPRRPGQPVAFIYARCSSDPLARGKSVERQVEDAWLDCERNEWWVGGIYVDNDRSASYAAKKDREQYNKMTADMRRTEVDVLVCWEASRATRDVRTYLDLADLSRELRVKWCFNGSMFDLEDEDDEFRSLLDVGLNHREVRKLSRRSRAGIAKAARDGLPHGGPVPYGYCRVYDQRTREFVAQEIDDGPREVIDSDGKKVSYTPAAIVREIFKRMAGGDSVWGIVKALNRRGIPSPRGAQWSTRRVNDICLNAVYAGYRVHHGKLTKGVWEPIVDNTVYLAVQLRKGDPDQKKFRGNKAVHLLSFIATCAHCGDPLKTGVKKSGTRFYRCTLRNCVGVSLLALDAYVESVLIERMSDVATLDWLLRPEDDDAQHAAEEAASLRATVDKWKAKAKAGTVDPDEYEEIVDALRSRIADLDAEATPSYIPLALRGMVGEQAGAAWDALELPGKRDIVRSIMKIEVLSGGSGRKFDPGRVKITWILDGASAGGKNARGKKAGAIRSTAQSDEVRLAA